MASSGSVDWSVSRNDIVTQALLDLGVMAAGDTTSSASFTDFSAALFIKLNNMVKQWSGQSDFAPGLKMWSRKRAYLFLTGAQAVYTLGPTTTDTGTTNKWASSYVTTTLSAAEAAGQTALSVTSITGISASDRLGVQLDSGIMHWSTVNGAPGAGVVTSTAALATAAAAGNRVFAYTPTTSQGRRPLAILTATLRDADGNDVPLEPMTLEEYEAISTKAQDADPSGYYYEQSLLNGTLYLDAEPADITKVIRAVYLSPIEDFDAAADTPDYDQNWYLPLCAGLAYLSAPMFGKQAEMPALKAIRDEAIQIARNAMPETSKAYYQCDAPV